MVKVLKRDGRIETFDLKKIKKAILKASIDSELLENNVRKVVNEIEKYLEKEKSIDTEKIFNVTKKVLFKDNYKKSARDYSLFSKNRLLQREKNSKLMKIYEGLTNVSADENNIKRENANIDGDTAMGTMLKYGSEGAKQFYEMYILDPEISKAHINGDIHIHDLDFLPLTTTCCQIDLEKLFSNGFSTGHGFLREPKDIISYAALACIAIQSNQNDQHGGQSIPKFDYDMAKGVAKTFKKLYILNLIKGFSLLTEEDSCEKNIRNIILEAENISGTCAKLEISKEYDRVETELLSKSYPKKTK